MHVSDNNLVIVESEEFHPLEEEEDEPLENKTPARVYSQFVILDEENEHLNFPIPHQSKEEEGFLNKIIPLIMFTATCAYIVTFVLKQKLSYV